MSNIDIENRLIDKIEVMNKEYLNRLNKSLEFSLNFMKSIENLEEKYITPSTKENWEKMIDNTKQAIKQVIELDEVNELIRKRKVKK